MCIQYHVTALICYCRCYLQTMLNHIVLKFYCIIKIILKLYCLLDIIVNDKTTVRQLKKYVENKLARIIILEGGPLCISWSVKLNISILHIALFVFSSSFFDNMVNMILDVHIDIYRFKINGSIFTHKNTNHYLQFLF